MKVAVVLEVHRVYRFEFDDVDEQGAAVDVVAKAHQLAHVASPDSERRTFCVIPASQMSERAGS